MLLPGVGGKFGAELVSVSSLMWASQRMELIEESRTKSRHCLSLPGPAVSKAIIDFPVT